MSQTDAFGKHEVLHTASILMDNWSSFIMEHGATMEDPELVAQAEKVFEAMHDFYNMCGLKFLVGTPIVEPAP